MISRRQGGGAGGVYEKYVEDADGDANKDSALILEWNHYAWKQHYDYSRHS